MILEEHLEKRHMQVERYNGVSVDQESGVVVFPLWNLSGQMVGYHQYRPLGEKKAKNHPKDGRYFTYLSGDKRLKSMGVWGLESLDYDTDYLVICEGVFDACRLHNFEIPCVALLTSSHKYFRNFLTCTERKICKVEDDHGSLLGPYTNFSLPDGVEDLGDCSEDQVKKIAKEIKEMNR